MLRNAIHGAPSWLGRVGQGIFVALILLPLFFTPAHAASLTLSWTDASTNEDGFRVQRKTGTTGSYANLATLATGTTGYVDGTVTAGTTYCYHVSAYNSAGDSAFSNEACAAPASATMYTVAVTKAGTGSGTVASSPAAINCGSTCSASIANGTSLALSATPAAGSTFTGWSGAYTGTGSCALVVDNNKNLTATFALSASTTYALTLTKAGTGSGTVTSSPTGINCGSTCSTSFNSGTSVTMTAAAASGSTFTGWSGAGCSGTGTCAVTMSAARSVTATFATGTQSAKAALTSPTPGSTLSGASTTFTWSAGTGVSQYWLYLGSTLGGWDLLTRSVAAGTLSTNATLPTDGRMIYARLHSLINGTWQWNDTTVKAAGLTGKAALTSPTPGSTLSGASTTFTWSAGTGVSQYWLYLGSTLGGWDLLTRSVAAGTLSTNATLPTDGRMIYARLHSLINGTWQWNDTTVKAAGLTGKAALTSPTPGSTLSGASTTFTWSAGTGVSQYWLYLGSTLGGWDLLTRSVAAGTLSTNATLPTDGRMIYARLHSLINGTWQWNDTTVKAAGLTTKAALTSLTANPAGALRVGVAVTFTATASGGTTPYQYKWWGFTGGTWVVIRDWNTSNTFSATTTTTGTFQVRVWVRNSGTTADSPDASGVLSITVTP